jgi:hypothetical protein
MRKYVISSIASLFLSVGLNTLAGAQEPAPAVPDLRRLTETLDGQIRTFLEALGSVEEHWEEGKLATWEEGFRPQAQGYTAIFREVFFGSRRNLDVGNQTLTMLDLFQWPRALNNRNVRLAEMAAAERAPTIAAWQGALTRLHEAYVRSLIAAYGFLEMVKRQYLYTGSPHQIREDERERWQQLGTDARTLHEAAQALMETFRSLRAAPAMARIMPYHGSYMNPLWEDHHGAGYFFRARVDFSRVWPLAPLFAPFPTTPPPGGPPRPVMRPAEEPPRDPPPGAGPGRWVWNGAEWQWQPTPQGGNGGVPPIVRNNRALTEFILSLQARLQTDEVQRNADLRRIIEGIIRQLGGPVQPLPPDDDEPAPMPRPTPIPGRIV